ncbi:MAG: hypothetical protein F6K19_11695 [Cyanothece sp. SIO1E1]|nr:hypothetical protein [Cyanothece sp. SIO1E1]
MNISQAFQHLSATQQRQELLTRKSDMEYDAIHCKLFSIGLAILMERALTRHRSIDKFFPDEV